MHELGPRAIKVVPKAEPRDRIPRRHDPTPAEADIRAEILRLFARIVGVFQQVEFAVDKPEAVVGCVRKEAADRSDRAVVAHFVGDRLVQMKGRVNRVGRKAGHQRDRMIAHQRAKRRHADRRTDAKSQPAQQISRGRRIDRFGRGRSDDRITRRIRTSRRASGRTRRVGASAPKVSARRQLLRRCGRITGGLRKRGRMHGAAAAKRADRHGMSPRGPLERIERRNRRDRRRNRNWPLRRRRRCRNRIERWLVGSNQSGERQCDTSDSDPDEGPSLRANRPRETNFDAVHWTVGS